MGLLLRGLRRAGVYTPSRGWRGFIARVVLANLAMAAALVWLAGPLPGWIDAPALERAGRLALCIGAGAIVYFAALYAGGWRPAHIRSHA